MVFGRVVVLAALRAVALHGACLRDVAHICGAVVLAAAVPADHVLRATTVAVVAATATTSSTSSTSITSATSATSASPATSTSTTVVSRERGRARRARRRRVLCGGIDEVDGERLSLADLRVWHAREVVDVVERRHAIEHVHQLLEKIVVLQLVVGAEQPEVSLLALTKVMTSRTARASAHLRISADSSLRTSRVAVLRLPVT